MSTVCGKITAISGPVIDCEFPMHTLPKIKEAIKVTVNDETRIMEVAQHIGHGRVRCILLGSSEGMYRGMPVTSEGQGITVPVGKNILGRMFNVSGTSVMSITKTFCCSLIIFSVLFKPAVKYQPCLVVCRQPLVISRHWRKKWVLCRNV